MGRKRRFSKRTLREAIDEHGGNVTVMAHHLGCSRQAVYDGLGRYPELKPHLDKERETTNQHLVDIAKNSLEMAILNGDLRAVMFALRQYDTGQVKGEGMGLSADVLMLLEQMNIPMNDVVQQFEQLIRQQAQVVK